MERRVIRFRDVDFSYGLQPPVFRRVSLEVREGLTLLVGPNGSGKSTLLKLAAGVEAPDAGSVEVGGRDLWVDEREARRALAYLPEQPDLTPYATLAEVLSLVCDLRGEPVSEAARALDLVGLGAAAGRTVRQLSMGQRRRAVLAAARIGSPGILLLDEPLEAMDRGMRDSIMLWIRDRLEAGAQVVVVTHVVEPFVELASRLITLAAGAHPAEQVLPGDPAGKMELLEAGARGENGAPG